jgi:hypothetical protein
MNDAKEGRLGMAHISQGSLALIIKPSVATLILLAPVVVSMHA